MIYGHCHFEATLKFPTDNMIHVTGDASEPKKISPLKNLHTALNSTSAETKLIAHDRSVKFECFDENSFFGGGIETLKQARCNLPPL